jgi:hypothetical protein
MKNTKLKRRKNSLQSGIAGFADTYLSNQKPVISYIQEPPSGLLHFVVVIPAYLEDKTLITLENLKRTILPKSDVEVIVLINFSESDSNSDKIKSRALHTECEKWCFANSTVNFKFYTLLAADLPSKHAGAGLARKIGMDQALQRFNKIGQSDGIILSLDADSVVDNNYFTAIEEKIFQNDQYGGCIFRFQHPLEGDEYSDEIYNAITQYELHLRYYKHILRYTGFPYCQYTIGSCFGVKADFYAQQGGMNRRKAGEDFYFLHKMFPHKLFADINTTSVYPSPRPSMRVPFGTGATITQLLKDKVEKYLTYSPEAFFEMKQLFGMVPEFYKISCKTIGEKVEHLPFSIKRYLAENNFNLKIEEIKSNTTTETHFNKRFFQWFDGFKVVKFLNYAHTITYNKLPVEVVVKQFLIKTGYKDRIEGAKKLLLFFRELDKNEV